MDDAETTLLIFFSFASASTAAVALYFLLLVRVTIFSRRVSNENLFWAVPLRPRIKGVVASKAPLWNTFSIKFCRHADTIIERTTNR